MKISYTSVLLLFLSHTCFAQINKVFSSQPDLVNWKVQLSPDGTYHYFYSDCTQYAEFGGQYIVKNDTVLFITTELEDRPYTVRSVRDTSNGFKFQLVLGNKHPDYHTRIFLNDTNKVYDSDIEKANPESIYEFYYHDFKVVIYNVTISYRLITDTVYHLITIPADYSTRISIYAQVQRGGRIDEMNNNNKVWLLKDKSLVNLSASNIVLSQEPLLVDYSRKKRRKK